ncbi:hydroxymethylglutaryl-CoA lyase [Deinococcus maricopensis]|uniref:Hydroxymethylglutaryl-CoA lyase n=1 Tax=Deinococcus maricopensis (strain DSM 21211 / LMG 22137 / NRRL B-23946 / LB-34) TaxID=709986 RepID=E8UAM2_DEIML|nr:hydroxymethylglutaryl-CoA lyase [Deinococcus maricopensis]ADV68111.1 Hydroxymethylglutaryl-CoA lyase [Deinococcus maricopensis DSM 21211]
MTATPPVTYVECPRDSWQGLHTTIPTAAKIEHLHALLDAGFTHLDLGSFVSARAIPQLADTEAVLAELPDPAGRDYLCIIANARGLERAATQARVTSVGYPLSVSDAFQVRNTGRTVEESWPLLADLAAGARDARKRLVVYLSMGFGNPDGDPWTPDTTLDAVARVRDLGIQDVALADTVGRATPDLVRALSARATARFGADGLGVHLHARPDGAAALAQAALDAGIRWFEGALGGLGGCPFAGDALVGNLPTERLADLLHLPYRGLDDLAVRARTLAHAE